MFIQPSGDGKLFTYQRPLCYIKTKAISGAVPRKNQFSCGNRDFMSRRANYKCVLPILTMLPDLETENSSRPLIARAPGTDQWAA